VQHPEATENVIVALKSWSETSSGPAFLFLRVNFSKKANMPAGKESLIVRERQEFEAQPLLSLDETIPTAPIDPTVTERKFSNVEEYEQFIGGLEKKIVAALSIRPKQCI
jgi:hypothetical protein